MDDFKFHIVTFGCQMNKLDSEFLHGAMQGAGFLPSSDPSGADIILYNTCSVREQAEHRVFSHLGTWRERAETDPGFVLGVIGCMAQRLGEEIKVRFPFVKLVCGTRQFSSVPTYVRRILDTGEDIVSTEDAPLEFRRDPKARGDHHHAYVSIMRGCDNYCSYCIVPYVRGREVSRPMDEIVSEVRSLADDGVVEVTLLGQNVNSYGKSSSCGDGSPKLGDLLREINDVESLRRIRFITSHPKDMSDDILKAVRDLDRVCEHIHMPAQSGSDSILRAMNRGYTAAEYRDIVEKARNMIPGVQFSSDFIVGFPGETDEDFEHTLSLLEWGRFQQSYIFRYSPRPQTSASKWEDDVPDEVKRERQQVMLSAQEEVDRERRKSLVGEVLPVLCSGENTTHKEEGRFRGRTRHNDIVIFKSPGGGLEPGDICDVKIKSATRLTLFGEVIS
jgi:tRNA-2-methylthio-N6-dimethylallyladenosine synthase